MNNCNGNLQVSIKKCFILFTLYCSLFTILSGCGKNPVLGYLPEQKAAENTSTGIGATATNLTLKLDISSSSTSNPEITIKVGDTPKIEWTYSSSIPFDISTADQLIIFVSNKNEKGYYWFTYNDSTNSNRGNIIKNTTSATYGITPSGFDTYYLPNTNITAKTLIKGEYNVSIQLIKSSDSNIYAALGKLIVQ